MNSSLLFYIVDFLFLSAVLITHYIAYKKGMGSFGRVLWAVLALYFGPIVILLIFICKSKPIEERLYFYEGDRID